MRKNFCSIFCSFYFVAVVLLVNCSFVFATITGNLNGTEYTYNSDSGSDNILTTEIFSGSYGVSLDTVSATKLTINGENGATAKWKNNTSLTMTVSGSSITVNKTQLTNDNTLTGTYFVVSNGSIVNNNSGLNFDCIYIDENSSFYTNIENTSAAIVNKGDFNITGGTVNSYMIEGDGSLTIKNDFQVNAAIKQKILTIKNGTVTVSSSVTADIKITIESDACIKGSVKNIEAGNVFENDGTIIFNSGEGNIKTKYIEGSGELQIIDGASVTNAKGNNITQNLITISNNSSFTTDAISVTKIKNYGNLFFTGGTNSSIVSGDGGILTVTDNLTNNATINQSSINITSGTFNNLQNSVIMVNKVTISSNACLISGISDIVADDSIENNGFFEINNSGQNTNVITGTGTLKISSSLINSASITQQTVIISSQLVTSFKKLNNVNKIDLEQQNSLLQITDDNDSVSAALITGSGSIEKQGAGTLELSNTNTYSGKTIITSGAIKISSGSNLGSSRIDMNGGKLIVDPENEIELDNEINVIGNNNINIEVVSSTLTLAQQISGNGNFIKTGSGTINLQAEQNSYTGNTQVLAGTLRGTTSNIKGKLIGTGTENSDIFEFYDNDTNVILNEIDTTTYLGTFNKTGSSTMTVVSNFKANNANIKAGAFVVNNLETDNNFVVVKDIKFTNSYLKGNADITAENVIIGENAVIAPGNSTGTIKVSNNLIFEDGSSYQAEIGQKDTGLYNDTIEAKSVSISNNNTSLNLVSIEGSYYQRAIFEIIKSNSNIETEFSTVTVSGLNEDDLAFESRIDYKVYNEANSMKVEISRKATDFANSPYLNLSHNQKEAAKAMDAISSQKPVGDISTVLQKLESYYYYKSTQDFDKLKASFDDIAGVIYANSAFLTSFNTKQEHIYDKIQERLFENLCYKWHSKIWAEYFYNNVNVDKNSNSAKFDSTANGIFAGLDFVSSKSLTLGITAGYGASELKQKSDKTDMKDFNFGLYGGFENEKWQIKSMVLAGMQQYETNRKISFMDRTASSSYNGYSFALDGQAGYKIELTKNNAEHKINLMPFIGLTGNYNYIDGFKEKGADDLNLKINSYNNFAFQARLGAGLNGKVNKFGWYGNLSLRQLLSQEYNEMEISLLKFPDVAKMNIYSGEISKTSVGLNLGADYMLDDKWTIFANTLALFAGKNNNFYFNIGLSYKFSCSFCSDPNNLQSAIDAKNRQLKEINNRSKNLEDELARKKKELEEAEQREKDLKDMLKKYQAKIFSDQEAKKIRETKIKEIRLDEKPTFIFGKAKLNAEGRKSLKEVAKELEKYPKSEILIEGHTDNIGTDKYNDNLSLRRAAAIMEVLKRDYKIKNKIGIIGKGKREPIYSNKTKAGRAKNRRVEIIVGAPEKG